MGFSTPSSEREAVMQISMVCGPYFSNPNSTDARNRLAERISVYIQTVAKHGQSNQPGDFNSSTEFKKLFGITYSDSPAVRYNKITTFRI